MHRILPAVGLSAVFLSLPAASLHVEGGNWPLGLLVATPSGCTELNLAIPSPGTTFIPQASCTWECPHQTQLVGDVSGSSGGAGTYSLTAGTYSCAAHFVYTWSTRYPDITFVRNDNAGSYPPTSIPGAVYDCTATGEGKVGQVSTAKFDANKVPDPRTSNGIPSGTWTCTAEPVPIPSKTVTVFVDPTDGVDGVAGGATALPVRRMRVRRPIETGAADAVVEMR